MTACRFSLGPRVGVFRSSSAWEEADAVIAGKTEEISFHPDSSAKHLGETNRGNQSSTTADLS